MRIAQIALAAALLASVAALPTARSMVIRETEFTCPIDGKKFKSMAAYSGTSFGVHLDLKPVGPIPAPWPLPKCPDNGFVLYKTEFTESELNRLRVFVGSDKYQSLAKSNTNYFLAAKLREFMGEPPSLVASSLLQATWEARNEAEYRTYATAALAAYEQVLSRGARDDKLALNAVLLAGELERRLGLFDRARQRFEGIPNRDSLEEPMNRIVKLQLALIAQKNKKTMELPPR